MRHVGLLAVLAALAAAAPAVEKDLTMTTSADLWAALVRTPYAHPNVPNVSLAGYRFGEKPLAEPKVVANVRDFGARGDGQADDTAAFKAALEKAKAAGGGAVLAPAGEYRLTDVIALNRPGLVLRGEGIEKTILAFIKPVSKCVNVNGSWYGGMVWIEPDGPVVPPPGPAPAAESVDIVRPARAGEFRVEVSPEGARRLAPLVGRMVKLTWFAGKDLCCAIAGHESMKAANYGDLGGALKGDVFTWHWANQIERVEGNLVTFKKPLRLDVAAPRGTLRTAIGLEPPYLTEVGLEHLSIRFPLTLKAAHLKEPGYNGVMFRRAAHSWVRDVLIENADSGIIFGSEAVNCTVTGWRLIGRPNHHGSMMRSMSHDNLIEDFVITSRPHHGLNTEGTSSGNVWHAGIMLDGTFDSHGMMSFDSVRTNIVLQNTGGPGGKASFGPFVGRRITHWNVRVTGGRGTWVAHPAMFPNGAIVGVQGAPLDLEATKCWLLPPGLDKGCIIADMGRAPDPADLYEAELRLRLSGATRQAGARGLPVGALLEVGRLYAQRKDAAEAKRILGYLVQNFPGTAEAKAAADLAAHQ